MRLKHFLSVFLTLLTLSVGQMWGLSSTVTIGSTNYPTAQTGTTVSGTGDLSSTWNIAVVANYFAGNDNGSIHAGSNNKTATSITLTSSSFSGKTITAVSVTGRDANGTESNRAVFTAKVNGSVFGSTSRFSSTSTPYTATGNVVCTGNVSVEVVRPSAQTKAIYVSAVSVTFNNGGTTYTVTYNLNGGTGTTPTEAAKAKDATFSLHNGTTGITAPSGKIFSQWKDQDNLYFNGGATYTMPAKNVTLTAQWVNAYTVTYNLNGGTGTTPTESKKAASATFTLHDGTTGITAPAGKGFSKWKDQDGNEYDASDTYTMPAKNVTFTAQWIDLPSYSLVTSVNQLYDGAKIIITNEDMDRALSTNQRTANREAVAVTCTNNIITPGNTVQIITLEESGDNWKFKVGTDSYLYASSSSSNELKTDNATTSGDNGVWSISIASDVATVVAQGTNSRNNMRYNPNNNNPNLFACYASSSANGKVKLFIEPATKATLTFDLNDKTLSSGSVPDDITNVTLNEAYTLPTTTLGATGYTFVGWNNDKNANSKLTTFTPTEATTYTLYAIWSANTNTEYKVKHYKQNLDGTYPASPTETDNLTGTTDASVTPARKSYTGFTAPSGTPSTILADGSLVVTYNYTRNSYALTWSTDGDALTGDYTGKSGNVKYEAPITAPNTPTKMGYTFSAWSPTPASTMPAVATTYTATWTCKIPNIAVDPVSAVYALNDEATPLSVTVEGAGAWCGYQWQSSSDNSNWSNIAAGDGGTSATYTPSTASAGSTTYYRVIVRNITDDCSTFSTSEAALVEVSSLPVCATPTFTPSASVAYNSNQTITISCETADVTIYYTVGATPADPTTESTQYDPDHKPVISASATIKAIAVKDSYTTSAVGSATYEFKCVAPTFSPAAGDVATGQEITLNCETAGTTIYYTMGTNPADPTTASTQYDPEDKPVVSEATTIKAIAVKDGWSNSDVASAAYAMIYTVTLNAGTGSVSAEGWTESAGVWTKTQASAGSSIPLPDAALSSSLTTAGWSFAGWKTTSAETTQTETKPDFVNKTYTPTSDITLYAVYQKTTGAANYELVEEDLDDAWAGDYLIAYSDEIFADGRKGGKDDEGSIGRQSTHVSPGDNLSANKKVVAGSWGNTYNVTLEEISENSNTYVMKTKDGKYNYQTSNANGLAVSANKETAAAYPISVTFNSSSDISLALGGGASGAIFHYNTSSLGSGGDVFRYYKNGGQAAIYLYKKGEGAKSYYSNPSDQVTLTYDANGATAGEAPTVPGTITIGTSVTVVAKPNDLVKTGYTFGGWNTKDDGTGTNYENGTDHQSFTINDNTTLYAKWSKNSYTVAVTAPGNGNSITAPTNNASVEYGAKVTLTGSAAEHWSLTSWSVVDTNEDAVSLDEEGGVYSFSMPASNVTVSATFTQDAQRTVKFYSNGAQVGSDQEVYVGEAPASVPTPEYETCLEGSNMFYGWATEEWTGAIASTAGKMVYTGALPNVAAGEGDVNYYAVWAKATTTFQKGTSADLKNGQKVVIVHNNSSKALENNDTWAGTDVTININQISDPASTIQWTVETTTNGFYLKNGSNQYLKGQNKSGGPYILLTNTANKWTLTNDGTYVLKDENNRYLEYYSNAFTTFGSYNSNNANCYVMDFYVPVMGDFRTNCCGLKPVTNVQVGTVSASSIELTWTAPTSKTGITKYQIVDDEHSIAQDVTDVDATSATVTGLTECTTYNFKVVSVGDDCNSNSNEVEATPFAGAKVVTFDYNGGSGATTSASTSCGVETVNLPTPNARDGYNFKGWNDGTQTLAPSTATYTPAATMTLTAQWAQLYTVHYDFDGASGAPDDAQYEAGATVELPSEPNKGFLAPFKAWDYSVDVTEIDETNFEMPANNLTITATYDEIVGQWILVTDESQLVANSYVIIAAANANKAIKTTQNGTSYRYITDITKSGSIIENPSNDVQIFVLRKGTVDDSWAFQCLNGDYKDKYIYANSSSNNYMSNQATNNANSSWKLDLEHGYATAQGDNTRNILSFNNDRFACYGNTNQGAIAFYEFREGTFYDVNMPAVAPTGGTVKANTTMAKAGDVVKLTYTPSRGYKVKTLSVSSASGDIAISPALEEGVTKYTFTMPAEAVTVAASFDAVPPVEYNLVTDAANLAVGMKFLMVGVNSTNYYANAVWNTSNGGYFTSAEINAPAESKISITTEAVEEIILEGESGAWKLMQGGSQRINKTWAISIDEGTATIENGNDVIKFNNNGGNNPRFKDYSSSFEGPKPALYALPYTTYDFELSGCKTIKVVTDYTYTYTIKNTDVPSSTPGTNYEFLNKWTDGTNTYAVGDAIEVSEAKTLQPCWKVTTPEEEDVTDIDGLPESVTEIVVSDGKDLNVNDDRTINTLTIKSTSGAFEVDGTSGQVTGGSTLTVTDNLYLEIKLCDGDMDATASSKWYCIAAPFDVAINGGFYWGDGTPMVLNTHFQLFEWDGDRRATGASGWRRTSSNMKAGVAYFIGFDDERVGSAAGMNQNTIKLKAMSNTISNTDKIVAPAHGTSGDYANWNGMANPNFHHIALDQDVQAFDYNKQGYSPYATGEYNFVVGTPFFKQYAGEIAISAANGSNPYRAPQRESEYYSYCVRIGSADASHADNHIYVRASETASAEFDNERDMITMNGTSSNYGALLWTENYGGKHLAIEEAPLVNGTASYVLTLSAPVNGTYSISVASVKENADLYLTQNGTIIWNLSMGEYTMDLNKGTTNGYGLLLQKKAPQTPTGVDEVDAKTGVQKIIINDNVFILRGGQMYDVTGKAVK